MGVYGIEMRYGDQIVIYPRDISITQAWTGDLEWLLTARPDELLDVLTHNNPLNSQVTAILELFHHGQLRKASVLLSYLSIADEQDILLKELNNNYPRMARLLITVPFELLPEAAEDLRPEVRSFVQ